MRSAFSFIGTTFQDDKINMTGQNICHRIAWKMLEYILSILQELSSTAADAQIPQNKQLPLRCNKACKGSNPKTMQPHMVFATKQIAQ